MHKKKTGSTESCSAGSQKKATASTNRKAHERLAKTQDPALSTSRTRPNPSVPVPEHDPLHLAALCLTHAPRTTLDTSATFAFRRASGAPLIYRLLLLGTRVCGQLQSIGHGKHWKTLFRNSASILLIAVVMSSTIAQRSWGYELKGRLTTAAAAIPSGSLDYSFRARVDGRRWSIRIEHLATASGVKYHEDAFDGTFSYHYEQMAPNPAFKAINTSFGVIDTNSLPCEGSPLAPGIWLAYCSADYFHGPSAGMIRKIFDSGFETSVLSNTKRRVVYELHPDAPQLPTSASFVSDGLSHSREAEGVKTQRLPPPFDKGYIAQRFTANTFTNAGGLWFPSSFTLEFLSPNLAKATSSNDISAIVTWKGVLNSVDPTWTGALADFVPVTDGATSTEDRRFPPVNSSGERVAYLNTNTGRWVPLANQRCKGFSKRSSETTPP